MALAHAQAQAPAKAEPRGAAPLRGDAPPAFLDYNSTAPMAPEVVDAFVRWANQGNPSAEHAGAGRARKMMEAFRRELAAECGLELDGPDGYHLVFTSGGAESNSTVVTGAVRAFLAKTRRLPHVVTSAAEHKSLLACCLRLAKEQLCQLTVLPVGQGGAGLGAVSAADLEAALRPNTCLVTVMAANNETGVLTDLRALAEVARRARVPFHSDAVQLFGKAPLRAAALGLDAFSASFHKLGGPPGVGLLALRRSFVAGYDLAPLVCGSQNGGLRGGTENLPGIGASFAAFRRATAQRAEKTARVLRLRELAREALAARLPCFYLEEHGGAPRASIDGGITPPPAARESTPAVKRALRAAQRAGGPPVVFWVAPADQRRVLPNTLLLAVRRPGFCNKAARAALEKRGVIVSTGAACTARDGSEASSGVLVAMGVDPALQAGALRVSLGDDTTAAEVERFVRQFFAVVTSDECLRT